MKLTDELLRRVFFSFLLLISFSSVYGQDLSESEIEEWHRRKYTLQLKKDNTFYTNDVALTQQTSGTYTIDDKSITLTTSSADTTYSETFTILTYNEGKVGKLALGKNGERITYLTESKSITGSFTWEGFLRGMLGVVALIITAFLLSKNKNRINWPLVIKGVLLQVVLAFLILKVPFIEGLFEIGRASCRERG